MVQHSTLKATTVLFKEKKNNYLIKTRLQFIFVYYLSVFANDRMYVLVLMVFICVFHFVVITHIHLIHSISKNLVQFFDVQPFLLLRYCSHLNFGSRRRYVDCNIHYLFVRFILYIVHTPDELEIELKWKNQR